jgi:hypothetical protein
VSIKSDCKVGHEHTSRSLTADTWTCLTMDYFLPLLFLIFFVILILWWFSALEYIGGRAGVVSFLAVFFGIRIDLLRSQRLRLRKLHEDTVQFVQNEIDEVYQGKMDPTGRIFATYCNLFGITASVQELDVDAFNANLLRLQAGRRRAGLRIPDLLQKLKIDMTFNSNAIEGNPISLRETTLILAGFVGPKRRSTRDVCDIIGHGVAFEEVLKLASHGNLPISMDQVKQVHQLILLGSNDGCVLRKEGEIAMISGTKVLLAMPDETEALLQQLLDWVSRKSDLHPFTLAVSFHYIFVRIHPFRDGNGRTARLLSNLILMQFGYPPIIVPWREKKHYMESIRQWDKGDPRSFTLLMANLLHKSFDLYFSCLRV